MSSSISKTVAAVAVEMDEMKLVSNVDYIHGPRCAG